MARSRATWACALALLRGASAWVRSGHEQINRIAEGLMHGKRKDQVRTMLHQDLFEVGGWELAMTGKHPRTEVLHWHHQNPEWTCSKGIGDSEKHIQCDGHGAEEGSLFCALVYFFDKFSHENLLRKFPEPRLPINTPSQLKVLNDLSKKDLDSSRLLRWLVSLLGDLHQPLHWLRGSHDYGRKIQVAYKGSRYSLLEFWEEYLPKNVKPPTAEALEREFQENAMNWGYKAPPELFRDWAREAAEIACEVYSSMEVNHADGSRRIDSPCALSDEQFDRWAAHWRTMAGRAGQRLAFVMQDVIEHRKHKNAHGEGRGHRHHKISATSNFLTNLCISAMLVPALLVLFRWHSGTGGIATTSLLNSLFKDGAAKA